MSGVAPGWVRAVDHAERTIARLEALGIPVIGTGEDLLSKRAVFTNAPRDRRRSMGDHCRLMPTRDGWCAVHLPRPDDRDLLPAWLGIETTSDAIPWETIASAVAERSGIDLVDAGQELGLAVSIPPIGEDAQLRDRDTVNPARPWIRRRVGAPGDRSSLDGALVVDLSSLWAGPLCARVLSDAGARVVKVESTTRPDGGREGDRAFFEWLHEGQEFVSLPLAEPSGVDELVRLLDRADVIIEGSRPRALDRMGITPAEVVGRRSGVVWTSITAYGRCGPWSDRVGFGDDTAIAAGLLDLDEDGSPCFVGDAVADPLTGLVAAALTADAVGRGGGVTIDVALREVARSAAQSAMVVW